MSDIKVNPLTASEAVIIQQISTNGGSSVFCRVSSNKLETPTILLTNAQQREDLFNLTERKALVYLGCGQYADGVINRAYLIYGVTDVGRALLEQYNA